MASGCPWYTRLGAEDEWRSGECMDDLMRQIAYWIVVRSTTDLNMHAYLSSECWHLSVGS